MANVLFKRGQSSALQGLIDSSKVVDGAFYLTEDTNHLYIGKGNNALAKINGNLHAVNVLPTTGEQGEFYYLPNQNILAYYDNGKWIQLNPDTNTKYKADVTLADVDTPAIRLLGKEITDADYSTISTIKFVGTGIATMEADPNGIITIDVPATDLSNYYTKGEVDDKLDLKADKSYVEAMYTNTQIDDKLDLKADKTYVDGEFKTAIDNSIATKADKTAYEELAAKVNHTETGLDTKASITALNEVDGKFVNYDTTTVLEGKIAAAVEALEEGQVKTNKEAIETLNGDDSVEGSVSYKVALEVAKIINDNDASDIDTLEEIAAWIKNDTAGVGTLNAQVQQNKSDIASLANTKADASTVYTKEQADATFTDSTEVDGQIDAKITALALGTMSKETATDYVKKSEATGYDDILTTAAAAEAYYGKADVYTKTEANAEFTNATEVDEQIDTKIEALALGTMSKESAANYYTATQIDTTLENYDLSTEVDAKITAAIEAGLVWGTFQ